MPTNRDYWNEEIRTVYTDVIEIFEADEDQNPVDPAAIVRINNSGNDLTVRDPDPSYGNVTYIAAAFNYNEPDRHSVNDETGSITIAGITNEYVEMLSRINNEHKLIVRIGLVDYDKAVASKVTGSQDYWVYKMKNYEASAISLSSAQAALQVSFKSGSMQLMFYISKWRYSNVEFPCLFG